MRVLHVIPAVAPEYGGPSHAIVAMCRALIARGVEVQIASTDAEPGGHLSVELESATAHAGVPAIFFHRELSEAFKYSSAMARWLEQNGGVPTCLQYGGGTGLGQGLAQH